MATETEQTQEAQTLGDENPNPSSMELSENPKVSSEDGGESGGGGGAGGGGEKRWPGWPGDCVFRLIVPVSKVGGIIGRKGELIKKMCEDTRARIKVLDGPVGNPDRIVLISGKEEPEVALSPAMDATIRVFKRVADLPDTEGTASGGVFCTIRLLVASTQAINLIGKQGSLIKSIQETTSASVRVLSGDELPVYASADERVVEIQGEAQKVLKALEAVVGHLRKFLVDHSVLPLFEKTYNAAISQQERQVETTWADKSSLQAASQSGISADYPLSARRESLFLEREPQYESSFRYSGVSLYGQDPALSAVRSTGVGRASGPIVTQVAQTMQIPISYAEDIIGIGGTSIEHIRRTSGAIITVQESRGLPDEITVEIKGTSSQVQTAQQLIQEFMNNHKEPTTSSYGQIDTGYRPSYSHLGNSYSSSLSSQSYGGYGSSGIGGYSTFRL